MFSPATRKDVIELQEDAESISLMLRFIYPPAFLDNLSLSLLKKSLYMGRKYDVDGILSTIDYIISHSNKGRLLQLNPTSVFGLAAAYQLKASQRAAAEVIQQPQNQDDINHLLKAFPDCSSVIGLLGAHLIRTKSLLALQNDLSIAVPIAPDGSIDRSRLVMCKTCVDRSPFPISPGAYYYPPWMQFWAAWAIPDLIYEPLHDCDKYFEITSLDTIADEGILCLECVDVTRRAGYGDIFKQWAASMKKKVIEIFSRAEPLYVL
ncbi:hypothetical protein FRC12_018239 [Ceratobasidium sp. 428]|nr:hypothetical protein FRC12_018239 [Ceratobasidium sp. 428]